MNKQDAKKRIDELRKETAYHAKRYYDDDDPEISDFEYDMLMNELKNLEKEYPEFITEDSLTQHVGGTVKEGFEKVEHKVPLQSLQDIFDFDELYEFDDRVRKSLNEDIKYIVETKIDGLSVSLEYQKGIFVRGATRGNGLVGEDVTENLKTINHIPKKLTEPIDIIVRGEVFIGKEDFEKVKKYINDNPGTSIEKVAEETEVSVKLITKWLREERLIITKGATLLKCEKCGKPIASGKLCDTCKQNLAKGFIESGLGAKKIQAPPPKDKPQDKGMHFIKT